MTSWSGQSLWLLSIVSRALRNQCVIMATLVQFEMKELFLGSKTTNTRSQEDPPEQEGGKHQNTMTYKLCHRFR